MSLLVVAALPVLAAAVLVLADGGLDLAAGAVADCVVAGGVLLVVD
jgi:hypothetical protein